MAEKTVLVCDVCGEPATQSATIQARQRRMVKDLCDKHVNELLAGARPVRRGRPRGRPATTKAKSSRRKSAKRSTRAARVRRKEASAA